ncbi:MAG TPA: hypothetical protein VMO20_04040 [Candidatus Acidoferrum sp.]|nr:hypothetical protein [Candidatus Acidoferrum sp.]
MNASDFSEPFTPKGVAAFARAKFNRLLLAQSLFALLGGIAVAWSVHSLCYPVIQDAVENLPQDGKIQFGQLNWTGGSPQTLAEGNFLALDVDLEHSGQFRSTAEFQIEFGRESIRVFSLFGYVEFFYPLDGVLQLNRPELQPLWEAWHSEILFSIAAVTVITLPLVWWLLATLLFLPAWLVGYFANRDLDLRASWKLSCSALLPGALLMILGIVFYGLGFLTLVSFLFIFVAHLVLNLLYLISAIAFFPRTVSATPRGNPFRRNKKP